MEVYEGVRGCPVASWAGVSGETRIITITIMSEGIGRKKKTKEEEEKITYLSTKANVATGFAVKTASRNASPMAPAPMTR